MAKFKKHKKLPQENKAEDVKTEKVVKEDVEMKEDEEEDIPIPDINVVNSKIQTDEESNDDDDQEEPVLGANEDDDCDDRKHTQKVYSEEERRQREQDKDSRSIFVGNLPTSVTRRDLRKHFKSCGDIDSVRVRGVIPEKLSLSKRVASIKNAVHEKCRSVFGYVVFKSKDSVTKAIELNTTKIGDNFITVQRLGKTTFDTDVTVFVGNLTPEIQENQIRDFFSDCGKIQGVRVIRDKQTGIGKGIAFVSFYSNDGVILALEKKGVNFCGRSIRIMKAGIQKKKLTKQEIKSNARNAKRRKMNQGKLRNDGQGDEKKSFKGGDGKVEKSIKKEKQSRSFSGTKTSAMQNKSGKRSLKKSKVNKKKKKLNEKKKITKILTA